MFFKTLYVFLGEKYMEECKLTKQECLEQKNYDEKYFSFHADENGYLSIWDKETGEKIKTLKFKRVKR